MVNFIHTAMCLSFAISSTSSTKLGFSFVSKIFDENSSSSSSSEGSLACLVGTSKEKQRIPSKYDRAPLLLSSNTVKIKGNPNLGIFVSWLYFMAISLNVANLPKFVNFVVNKGDTVSGDSAKVYGNLAGIDSLFTFLSVNLVGCLSDYFGRKPFIFGSSIGLGLSYLLVSTATRARTFYIASIFDGLTSCMFSQAQTYIADCVPKENIGAELGKFQGLAVGMSFMLGIPIGAVLGSKISTRVPILLGSGLCFLGAIITLFFLPESLPHPRKLSSTSTPSSSSPSTNSSLTKERRVNWKGASPLGGLRMLTRTPLITLTTTAYFLINLAQGGLQIQWMNYLQHRFGWTSQQSGMTLLPIGVVVAILPGILIPRFGVRNTIKSGLLVHALSMMALGIVSSPWAIIALMPFVCAGGATLPTLLGYLTEQVDASEVGALQGAADSVRTIANVVTYPLMSVAFGYFISPKRSFYLPGGHLIIAGACSLVAFLMFTTLIPLYSSNTTT